MKLILFGLITLMLIISCSSNRTEKQLNFAAKLTDNPLILEAEWSAGSNMWVKVNPDSLGIHAKVKAQELANEIAAVGIQETGKTICVHVYFTSYEQVGSTCLKP